MGLMKGLCTAQGVPRSTYKAVGGADSMHSKENNPDSTATSVARKRQAQIVAGQQYPVHNYYKGLRLDMHVLTAAGSQPQEKYKPE